MNIKKNYIENQFDQEIIKLPTSPQVCIILNKLIFFLNSHSKTITEKHGVLVALRNSKRTSLINCFIDGHF